MQGRGVLLLAMTAGISSAIPAAGSKLSSAASSSSYVYDSPAASTTLRANKRIAVHVARRPARSSCGPLLEEPQTLADAV